MYNQFFVSVFLNDKLCLITVESFYKINLKINKSFLSKKTDKQIFKHLFFQNNQFQ